MTFVKNIMETMVFAIRISIMIQDDVDVSIDFVPDKTLVPGWL